MLVSLTLLLATAGGAAADSLMTPGVSHALALYRADRISNVRYELVLDVTNRDTVSGTARVVFQRRGDGDVILDFRGYALGDLVVNGNRVPNPDWNRSHLRIPAAHLANGANTAVMRFAAPIAPAGASVIRFTDDTDRQDYLYTLLVPSDANLLFPCFDQPDLKGVFGLRLTVPRGWRALSNGALEDSAVNVDDVQYRFGDTAPISTYLFAFAAGPYAIITDTLTPSPAPAMSIWVRRSRAREVEGDSLLALHRRSVAWLADYFAIPYPFGKMDMLLAPAFPFGGMEHPGAIFYNEESFIFREPPTLPQRLGRQATIHHEVAHQWFGDYTTMRWFDDLWMKEGFSTFMAARMLSAMGDSTAWMSFYLRNKPTAYDVDATAGTTPVWQALGNLDQAKSNYGAIVYNKAPGVLKQLEYLVGETAFREGLRQFLRSHAFGNATWRELLGAIGTAAGRDLLPWGNAWFLRPGMPVVEQQLTVGRDGRIERLALIQRPAQPLSGAGSWPMKVQVLLYYPYDYPNGGEVLIPVELRGDTTVVSEAAGLQAPGFVYPNSADYGYGLFMLDDATRDWLLGFGMRVSDPFLRAMLWGSLWDLVRDARLDPIRFVDAALDALPREQDEQIASRLIGRVGRALDAYLPRPTDERFSRQLRAETVFLAAAANPSRTYGIRKSYFDAYVGIAKSDEALARLNAWLDSTTAAGEPLRQPTRWAIVTRLMAAGHPGAHARLAAETRRDTTSGGRRRAFIAGAAEPSATTKRAWFTRYFADSTLNEDWVTASLGAFNDPDQSALTLDYLRPALDTVRWVQDNRRIFFLGRWLDAFIGGHRSPEALAVVDAFLAEHPELPRDLRQKVLQSRDDLERTVRIRARFTR